MHPHYFVLMAEDGLEPSLNAGFETEEQRDVIVWSRHISVASDTPLVQ